MLLKALGLMLLFRRRRQSSTAEVSEAGCWTSLQNPSCIAKEKVLKFVYVICLYFLDVYESIWIASFSL